MIVHLGVDLLHAEWSEASVCIGTFDGVHLGHQALIRSAVALGCEREWPSVVVTFDRHPAAILAPDRKPPCLASVEQNLRVFERLGVAVAVVLPFDHAMSQMSADDFLSSILRGKLRAGHLTVGHDFAMGHGRVGTTDWLSERIPTTVISPVEAEGHRVSSSEIRALVAAGEVDHAARLLGHPYALSGVVVGGRKLGRELGYPTLNLARSSDQVLPSDGVYAGRCHTSAGEFLAAISVGVRPTVEEEGRRLVEAYLLDYPGASLYGQAVELEFTSLLRSELKFESLEELKMQIALDVERIRLH